MKTLILALFIAFASFNSFAHGKSKVEYYWQKSHLFKAIAHLYSEDHQSALNQIVENNQRYRDYTEQFNIDLTIYDLVDQMTIMSKQERFSFLRPELAKLKGDVLKKFGPLLKKMIVKARKWEHVKAVLKKLIFQPYDKYDSGLRVETKILRAGSIKRLLNQKHVFKYNLVAQDPESRNLLVLAKREVSSKAKHQFITPRLTVTSAKDLSKRQIKRIKKGHYKVLNDLLKAEVKREEKALSDAGKVYKLKLRKIKKTVTFYRKNKKDKKLEVSEIYRRAIVLTNQLYKSKLKSHFIEEMALQIALRENALNPENPESGFTIVSRNGIHYALITPHYIAANLNTVKQSIKDASFQSLIDYKVDWALMAVKKFLKKKRKTVDSVLEITLPKKITIDLALELYPSLKANFPSQPWMNGAEVYNKYGFPIDVDIKRFERWLGAADHIRKQVLNVQNISGLVSGVGVTLLTGNPLIGTTTGTVIRDVVYAKRYDKNIGKYLLENTPRNLATTLSYATGYMGGKLMHAFYVGAVGGIKQSIYTGRPVQAGMIVGAITSAINAYLPPSISNPVISGMNKDLENALLEYVYEMANHSVDGFFVSLFTDGDIQKGVVTGAIYGIATTTHDIYYRGFKYDPSEFVTQEDIDNYLNGTGSYAYSYNGVTHNELMADRAYDGKDLTLSMDDFRRTVFRKNSPWRKSFGPGTEEFYRSNYRSGVQNVSMGIGREGNVRTLIHEAVHHRQYQTIGFQRTRLKKTLINSKILEDYISLDNCDCLDNGFQSRTYLKNL